MAAAQPTWIQRGPGARSGAAMAYDAHRGCAVMVGGSSAVTGAVHVRREVFEYDGDQWRNAPSFAAIGDRYGFSVAYDRARRVHVLFGGHRPTVGGSTVWYQDTWTFDGTTWTEQSPATSPSARARYGMAFDESIGRIVLFGGEGHSGRLNDTWEWTGTNWVSNGSSPVVPATSRHAMAWSTAANAIILFGGGTSTGFTDRTYSWSGRRWTAVAGARPPARADHAVADVTSGLLMFGGLDGAGARDDTWMFAGGGWSQVPAGAGGVPPAQTRHAMAQSGAGGAVMFGIEAETWEWAASTGWQRKSDPPRPSVVGQLRSIAMDYHGGSERVVLFDGDDTWLWDGSGWSKALVPAGSRPPQRAGHAMAYDPLRDQIVMFGGKVIGGTYHHSDTWVWDGSAWSQPSGITVRPPGLAYHCMAFDGTGIVLFGGNSATSFYRDQTWRWDGSGWSQLSPSFVPPGRANGRMVWDSFRRRAVLFGGGDPNRWGDTWEWDGSRWSWRSPNPAGRIGHDLAYDSLRYRTVLFGGVPGFGLPDDTWEWNGSSWTEQVPATSPPGRQGHAMAFDAARLEVVLFGGVGSTPGEETWIYRNGPNAWTTQVSRSCVSSFEFTPNLAGSGYTVSRGVSWDPRSGFDIAAGDDTITRVALAFPFRFPDGVSTTSIDIDSNGRILRPGSSPNVSDYTPTISELLASNASCNLLHTDLSPNEGGAVHFHGAGTHAAITWYDVPQYQRGNALTMQLLIRSDGSFVFSYKDLVSFRRRDAIVGCSEGGNAQDPGEADLSVVTGGGRTIYEIFERLIPELPDLQLELSAISAPNLGTTWTLRLDHLDPNTSNVGLMLGLSNPNLDLRGIPGLGLAGNLLLVDPVIPPLLMTRNGESASIVLPTLLMPSWVGLHLWTQSFAIAPGTTELGVEMSNGVHVVVGY